MPQGELDQFYDLKTVGAKLSMSRKTVVGLIHDPVHALPAYRIKGKTVVNAREFNQWIERFRIQVADPNALADEVIRTLKVGEKNEQKEKDQ